MKWEIMKRFSTENKHCFSYRDVLEEYPDKDGSYLSKFLTAMVNTGMLMKLLRDLYCIIPLSADPESYPPSLFGFGQWS
jgi:predicted transcriptional regulator of viral defense system